MSISNLSNINTITVPTSYGTGTASTITLSGAGTSGQYFTTNGTWTTPNHNFVSSGGKSIMTVPHGEQSVVLEKNATLEVKGNVKINGIDLEERLKTIERVLAIPERDATMEAKYPSLKKKFDDYINSLEKYRTFERIKGEDE